MTQRRWTSTISTNPLNASPDSSSQTSKSCDIPASYNPKTTTQVNETDMYPWRREIRLIEDARALMLPHSHRLWRGGHYTHLNTSLFKNMASGRLAFQHIETTWSVKISGTAHGWKRNETKIGENITKLRTHTSADHTPRLMQSSRTPWSNQIKSSRVTSQNAYSRTSIYQSTVPAYQTYLL